MLSYQFGPVTPTDKLDDVHPVKPLPPNLLDPSRWDVPNMHRLSNLTGVLPTAVAFEQWASETLGLWEHYWKLCPIGEDGVREARERFQKVRVRHRNNRAQHLALLAEVRPLLRSGMTMWQAAAAVDIGLEELAALMFGFKWKHRAEHYAEIERAILAGEDVPTTKRRCVHKYGFDARKATALLIEWHYGEETVAA